MANLSKKHSKKEIDRVNKFFNRENVYKQLKTMVSFLIPHKRNVKLTLNIGGGSYTNGKAITVGLPEMFVDKSFGEIFSALRALIGHESQHINSSDFEAFVAFQKDISEYFFKKYKIPHFYGQKVAKHLFNSVEDGRIEKILCNKLPGYTKHIKFLNGSFWEAQEMKGNSELEDFLYTITTYSVTGLYPKGFKDVYKDSKLHENFKKIERDIHDGIDAVTCKQCFLVCHDIIDKVEDYLVELLQNRSAEDEEFMRNIPEQNEFTTSEETEKNTSDSVSTHFVPRKKKEEKKEESEQDEDQQDGEGVDSEKDEQKGKSKKQDKKKGKGKDKKEENEEDSDEESASGKEGSEEYEESEDDKGSLSGKSEDEESDEEAESGSGDKSDEETDEESSDSKGNSSEDSENESEEKTDDESGDEGDDSDSDSKNNSDIDSDSKSDEKPEKDDVIDEIPESTNQYPKGVKQPEEEDDVLEIDEEKIREQMKEITDDVIEEAKARIQEESSPKKKSSKAEMPEEINHEDLMEVESKYKKEMIKRFKEIKGFDKNHSLPVEIKREGSKFRKEVEKIFQNKETFNLRSQRKGVLDTSNLYKFAMKDYNMFVKRGAPVTTDYVAFILQDGSGSMQEHGKEFQSAKAMAVLEEGLKGIIPFKISTFSVDWNTRSVVHYTAKDWNENNSTANHSYNFHRSRRATGGNKDGYSIRVATSELLRRPEKDRILVILSDGLPSDYNGGQTDGMVDVKQAVKEARSKGIHVVSLIFGTEDFRDYNIDNYKYMYDRNIISCQPEQITSHLVKNLKKIIAR